MTITLTEYNNELYQDFLSIYGVDVFVDSSFNINIHDDRSDHFVIWIDEPLKPPHYVFESYANNKVTGDENAIRIFDELFSEQLITYKFNKIVENIA